MKRKKELLPMAKNEMEKLPTKRLLARLKILHQCEQSLELSDLEPDEYVPSEYIKFKESPEWITEYNSLKEILSKREHIQ